MNYLEKYYIIGIDLGTTNSAVSYINLKSENKRRIKIFKIPQLTGHGEFSKLPILPSFLYIPGQYDIEKEAVALPWNNNDVINFVGAYARDHGSKMPFRLVSSAKSWLCHKDVDRKARILPWGSGDDVVKISPVQATAAYLKHIKAAWNYSRGDNEELYLENQIIIITVPASFNEIARDLTLEAAEQAGISNVTLLEEPLAAFYSWLMRHENNWSEFIKPDELILICDVGGGTTDFTLITLKETENGPKFERIAVGDHLILGGDNMDLALARHVEMHFGKKHLSLSADRWKTCCHQCRQAKEIILSEKAKSKKITLIGEGSKLIAGTVSADLNYKEVEKIILQGFFPSADSKKASRQNTRKGITEFGLPYEQEPAITHHLCWFLEKHKIKKAPNLILFNGGALKPIIIQNRIKTAIRHWFKEKDEVLPQTLENPDLDIAVALGASYYGLVKIGHGIKVGSGSARAFYLAVEQHSDKKSAICLIERGLDEGTNIKLQGGKFEVLANQPVSFDVYSSSFRYGDKCGDIIEIDDTFTSLPPIQTVVQFGEKGVKAKIPVQVETVYTEIGTLALWCRSVVSNHRWKLEFQLRNKAEQIDVLDREVFEQSIVDDVLVKIRRVFSDKFKATELENLVKSVAKLVKSPKEKWPFGFIRSIADELLRFIDARSISPAYESRWLNLTGFCLRPGFGDAFDEHRIKKLWKIYKQGPLHSNNAQVRSEWWIIWRRIAGGLKAGQQRQFLQNITPIIMPKKTAKVRITAHERVEIWMAVANMERLLIKDKIKLGRALLSEIKPKKCNPQLLWSILRIGARQLLYGQIDRTTPSLEVSSWIQTILSQTWRNPKIVGVAVAQLARKTGDRVRDIDSSVIEQIIEWMSQHESLQSYQKFLKEIIPITKHEESAIFGESLPSGIFLRGE